jgi:2-polyprenyl-6-hydroxyphenyl methylase/3-demethylubiquinone-9 3-methyltransferase
LRSRYFPDDRDWRVEPGSALDGEYLESLGVFDVVYAWGVLHHTGRMWDALDLVSRRVAPGGQLFIALYNDQGARSRAWKAVKRGYVAMPRPLRLPYALLAMAPWEGLSFARALLAGAPGAYFGSWGRRGRGMSRWHDLIDWVGGYPFEVARPDEVEEFCAARGFRCVQRRLTTGLGCNQFVFERTRTSDD